MPNLIQFPEILTSCRFYLELKLDGSEEPVDAYFMECKGFKRTHDVIELCEVTSQQWGKAKSGLVLRSKIPGNTKTNNITLKRGMTKSLTLWKWFAAVEAGNWAKQLRDGSLSVCDQESKVQASFQFKGAFPVSYSASDLSASSGDIEIEEMEMAVEMFERVKL
jgi:phage tail-like protein